jgi:ribonuclease E
MTQIALLEGRTLVEHYISRASDDATQIDGNIYRGRVQNVLPGMEAAFIDIGTPKNAVLYHGDVRYDTDDVESPKGSGQPRIEQLLKPGQTILCQVTKNPIGAKGARLTQEVSLPGSSSAPRRPGPAPRSSNTTSTAWSSSGTPSPRPR